MPISSNGHTGSQALRAADDAWAEDELATKRLIALIGHELRTPLASALLYIDIAERRAGGATGGPAVRAALSVARGEVKRLDQLVGRVMELERFGHAVMHPCRCDLGRVVRAAVQRSAAVSRQTRARVRLEIPGGDGLFGWWDATAVEQIVQNLLSNALRFGKDQPIEVALEASATVVRLIVRDRGVGIGPADRERIFRRYVRSPAAGGLGLGLWLVRELAIAHGGAVAVRSRHRRGAVFTVTLRPLRARPTPGDAPAAPPPSSSTSANGLTGAGVGHA